jgi:hypothetical protein
MRLKPQETFPSSQLISSVMSYAALQHPCQRYRESSNYKRNKNRGNKITSDKSSSRKGNSRKGNRSNSSNPGDV